MTSIRFLPSAVLALFCATLLATVPALAGPLEDAASAYAGKGAYDPMPIENIEGALADLLGADEDEIVPVDRDISPIEKALLLIDTQEEPLPRARYLLRYGQRTLDGVVVSFIEVERFNLGPATRLEAIAAYGAENVAGPEIFGLGPHVAWRFVTVPSAKSAAVLLAAGRKEIEEAVAARNSCLGRTCLSLDTLDDLAAWEEWTQMGEDLVPVAYPAVIDVDGEELAPAYQALELGLHAGLAEAEDGGVVWTIPTPLGPETGAPFIVVLIDRNLGQEILSDAALGIAPLDKEGLERWTRISGGIWADVPTRQLTRSSGSLFARKE